MYKCKHCSTDVKLDKHGQQWVCDRHVLPQYCWVDPVKGSQLHEPNVPANREIWLVAKFSGLEVARLYIAQFSTDEELDVYNRNGSPKRELLAQICPRGSRYTYIVVDAVPPAITLRTETASEMID